MQTSHQCRAAIARAVKAGDPAAETDARRSYAAAKIAENIRATVAKAPALNESQVAELTALLSGGGR